MNATPADTRTVALRSAELAGWAGTASVGAVMLTQAVGWDGSRLIATLQALTPYGLPIVLAIATVASFGRRDALAAGASAVAVAVLFLATPIAFPSAQAHPAPDADGITATAINLLYSNPQVREVADDLAALDSDVIVFSEYTIQHQRTLLDHPLVDRYPHQINRDGLLAGGMAVWSKYPLEENARIDTANRTVDASIDGPDGVIRLLAVHPPTPIYDFAGWQRELDQIGDAAATVSEPILVIGDFNASYWHPKFRDLLARGLTDAHMAHGEGWSTSWPTDDAVPPFVRLDHALTGNGLVSTAVDDFRVPGSDHAGVVVTVKPAG